MNKFHLIIFFMLIIMSLSAYQADVTFTDSWEKQGLSITQQSSTNIKLNYSINNFRFEEILIDNENLTNIHLPEVFLPNDEGMPNLPGSGNYIAIPQGARVNLNIVNYRVEKYSNIEIAPAPRIPLDTEDGPLEYNRNNEIYNRNTNYPENFIQLSEPTKLRGVDVVMLGITPFQYNPITKELLVYRDIEIEITYSDGIGHFGEDRLRSRWWDPIIKDAILNSSILPKIDYNSRSSYRDGAEYLIICPDDTDFITWANTIKDFRQQQGISTMIQTVTQIGGNTVSAIQTYVDNAYNNWSTPPSAVLLLGDYGTGTSGIISEFYTHPAGYSDFVSDNYYADVDGDDLPDVVFARITANDAAQLEVMITKFIDYENNPPTDPDFYNHPITALGWQTERWFQICSEVVGGYFREALGKDPIRINAVYSGTPSTTWSTATNTADVVNYFGPSGLGYIPATPAELGGWTGGTATDVVNAINAGSFLLQHRDHGSYSGWGEPSFQSTNISSLTNVDNKLPFIFSINCQTGAFHNASECFTEKFHRHTYDGENSGALGLLAATEVSYSFVNDTFVWGVMDNMFPDFMPAETANFPTNYVLPSFGNAAGKHFLYRSGWPYNTGDKLITYRLFHHHGDAFLNVYSEVPTNLTINHTGTLISGATTFSVTADTGSYIALTVNNEIIGTADGTGSPVDITIPAQSPGTMLVTVTKQNYFRYSQNVNIIVASGPYVVVDNYTVSAGGDDIIEYGETVYLTTTLKNEGVAPATNVNMVLSETDTYITLTDAAESFGTIAAGTSVTRTTAYTFTVSNTVPNDHSFILSGIISSVEDTWNPNINLVAFAPVLSVHGVTVIDGNDGRLDPDETADIVVSVENTGGAAANNINAILSTLDSYISINNGSDTIGSIAASTTGDLTFNITTNSSTPIGHSAEFDVDMTADLGYAKSDNFFLTIGLIFEDFETGDFTSFNWPWTFDGEADWAIVDVDPYEGIYSGKSGVITHSQTSGLILTADVTADGTISFFRKVSSESSYDYLKFFINGSEQESWSGEVAWGEVSYSVPAGNDVEFKWQYLKDSSVDSGSDCAWVDYIIFPALGAPQSAFVVTPPSLEFGIVETGTSSIKQFTISNTGGATLNGNITTPAGYTIAAADYMLTGSIMLKNENNSDNTISYSISGTSNQTFDLAFSPLSATTYSGNVVITSNDPDHLSTDLPVTGIGGTAAVISVTPATLDFGDTTFGSNSTLQFTIENTGGADLTGSITTSVDFSVAEFSEVNSRITLTDNAINYIISGGNSVIYDLTFSPTTLGSYSDNISITHNATGGLTLLPVSGNCVSTIVFPYLVDFENAGVMPAEWSNAIDDDFDWTLLTGATGSSSTGPSGDHTTGSDYYIYTESSSPNFPSLRADLLTPILDLDDLTTPYISYWYHMYGAEMGSLHIDLSDGVTWQEDIIPPVSGDQDNQWIEQFIDLSAYSGTVQIRFRGITGSSYTSDMAIDDFWIGNFDPPEIAVNPLSLSKTLTVSQSSSQILQIANLGSGILDYTASISYTSSTLDDGYSNYVNNSGSENKTDNLFGSQRSISNKDSQSSKNEFNRVLDYLIIGAGSSISSSSNDTPFGTYYEDGQNQYLFTASELYNAGLVAGDITTVGWNISSASTQAMNGFNVEMKLTSATSVTAFETGFSNCYTGTWTAVAGWNDIPFSTPFIWDGTSNILVKICFDNDSYTTNSSCYIDTYAAMNAWAYNDGTAGCTDPYEGTIDTRSQTRFSGTTLHWLTIDGESTVAGSINPGSSDDNLTVLFDTVPDNLVGGVYEAVITITSNDMNEPSIIIPVTLNVTGQLDPPSNVRAEVEGINVQLNWDLVSGATMYHIYYSTNPHAGFTELNTSITNSYEHIGGAIGTKLFYYITAE